MITNPTTPYFFSWLMNQEQTILGTQFDQTLREQLEAQQVYSPVTNTNISLVLDPTAPVGVNPYVADITVQDTKGNMALGSLPVTIKASNGAILATGTAVNGTTRITLPDYEPSATAVVGGNNFYIGSQAQNFAKFDVGDMLRRLGPPGSDPVTNAKWAIISNYTIDSGAFNHNDVTDNYTWNGHDNWNGLSGCYKWTDSIPFYGSVDRGYCVISAPQIAASELKSHTFDSQKFAVRQYWGAGVPPSQFWQDWTLSKMDFFSLWLGQKLEPTSWGGNPHDPDGYAQFNALANDLATYADKIDDQQYLQTNPNAKQFSARVQGLAKTAEQLGFSQPQGALEQLADYVNDKINAVIGYIQSKWDQIVNFVGTVVNLITIVWNAILGPVLGAVIETVKIITNLIIEGFKTILTSFLNSPSPNNPFTDLSNEYINPQTSKNFLMNWKTFIPLDTMLNDIASDYNQVKTITNTFASLTNIVDPTKMIPDDLSIFQDLFKLISPTFVYDIFINLLVDILTKSITDILLQAISTTFQTDEAVISFFNNVIVTFGDRISNSYSDLINFSPNKGINFPVNQYSTPTILINSIFSDISDLIDSITSIIGFNLVGNLVINFGNTLFNLIFGLFYPSGTIPQTSSLLLLSCIGEFIPSILGLLGDKIWGGNEFGAYLEGKTIPQQALAITKVLGELVLDFTGICYSSATIYMLNEYNSRISGTADKIYIQKLAYLGENAPIIAFNLAGEFLEDSAKIFINQNKMYDDNNKIANRIEAVSEVVRIFANFYYVLRYSLGFLDYVTTNFNGSLPDILFSVGYLAFVIGAFQNLIGNFWGLALNYYDFSIGQYTGGDTPTLLFNNPNYWDILDVLFPIITGFTGIFGSKLAGLW